MSDLIKTYDCKGCRGHCYGGYHMDEDKDGYGDWVSKEDHDRAIEAAHARIAALESQIAAAEKWEPVAQFDNPRVQAVYEILCGDDDPPMGEHWEGWVSRRIVDALSTQGHAVPANVTAALDRMCTPLDESVLKGATAEADAHSMKLIRDYVLATPLQSEGLRKDAEAAWFALADGAAASLENAAVCMSDTDAKRSAEGAAAFVRKCCREILGSEQVRLMEWRGSAGLLWDVYAFGKWSKRIVSPIEWDAHTVYLDMVRAGYSKHIELRLVSASNNANPDEPKAASPQATATPQSPRRRND